MIDRRTVLKTLAASPIASPVAALAQAKSMPVIGFLNSQSPADWQNLLAAFRLGLQDGGFAEGQNVQIEYRWAEGRAERLPALAKELVERPGDMLVATGGPNPVAAAKSSTTSIPIVFTLGSDPRRVNFVTSLARPDGNLTGFTLSTSLLGPKRLELLHQIVPPAAADGAPLAVLVNPAKVNAMEEVADLQQASVKLGRSLTVLEAADPVGIDAAFERLPATRSRGLLIGTDGLYFAHRSRITGLAARYKIPTIYEARDFVDAGGLVSYGTSFADVYRRAGLYVARVLRGAKPADLPIQEPTRFELVVNARVARNLGLTLPPAILTLADEVIE